MSALERLETKVKQIESRLDGIDYDVTSLMKSQKKDLKFIGDMVIEKNENLWKSVEISHKRFAKQARLNEEIEQKVENILH